MLTDGVALAVNVIDLRAPHFPLNYWRLRRYLKRRRPESLLTTLFTVNVSVLLATRLLRGRPRIVIREANTLSVRGEHEPLLAGRLKLRMVPRVYRWADRIVAPSKGVADDLVKTARLSEKHITVIYNPVVTPGRLRQMRERLSHPWFQEGQPPVILGVGRLVEQKDFGTLIRAFKRVRRKRNARLMILGEGPERTALERLTDDLNVAGEVALPGYVDNVLPFMRESAVFVLSSAWEGLPGVLIEAMACGCPVVSTDCPSGPTEVLCGGKYGHLVPVGAVEPMADAIRQVLAGKTRTVPRQWLEQFSLNPVIEAYSKALGIVDGGDERPAAM